MDTTTLLSITAAAVWVFWSVGAYNRLVGLRNELLRCFAPVDEQLRARQALLQRWAEGLDDADEAALQSFRAACQQVEGAGAHARANPSRAGAMTSLRLADEILMQARAKLPAAADESLAAAVAEADTTLAFARRQFNEAAQAYNRAVSQFPTWVLSGLFGFRKAGTL
ncbi:LemA family protein [Piscinibacter aquaticus]|uniref:LemA family protein n=1 Tax=Piscinibacter aquaticus TaxID=392597 RepID=A0A5C6U5B7_9BURK|nr:LemA family protein [Piscinibacter aquaticus]